MNQVKFYLKKPKDERSLVICSFTFSGNRIILSTGVNVITKHWNKNRMRVQNTTQYPQSKLANQSIDRFEDSVRSAYKEILDKKITLSGKNLKNKIKEHLEGVPLNTSKDKPSLHLFLDNYLELKKADNSIKQITIRNYEKVIRLIKKYEKSKVFSLSDIDKNFHIGFKQFLHNTKFKKGKDKSGFYQPNYIARLMKSYRGLMRYAFSEGLIRDQSFSSKELTVSSKETDTVYLNAHELESINNLDLSENPKLERARDLFLIGCHTGLRFSDVAQLNMNQVIESNGKFLIKVPTKKTGKTVIIPLKNVLLEIIDKYDGFPKNLSNQKLNEYIKEVCKLAEINDKCLDRKYVRGKTIKEYKEKWEMVSSHTARRSFATNAYLKGISPIKIMKITGHKKESTFLKYIRITELENALDLADNDFFN